MARPEGALIPPPSNSRPSPAHFPSPFDKLTAEMIRRIFTLTFKPEDLRLPPWPVQLQPFASNYWLPQNHSQTRADEVRILLHVVLSLVCRKWLDIVTAHHSLWATFQIDPIAHLYPRFSAQLRQHLRKSGAHALKIEVRDGSSDEAISGILEAMMVHSERWGSIEFHFPMKYAFLHQLDAVRDRLPLLQRLHIRGPREPYPSATSQCAVFQSAPMLRDISLEQMDEDDIRIFNFPWPRISHARLDFHTATGALLFSLQTLTTLTLYRGGTSYAAPANNLNFAVTLENLQDLHVLSHTSGMGRLTCPALQELDVCNEDGASVLAFLDNAPASPLVRLELRYIEQGYPRGEGVPQILAHRSLAGVTFLKLAHCGPAEQVLDALVLDSGGRMPVLETLVLGLEFSVFQLDRDFKARVEGLCRIIQSRTCATHVSAPSLSLGSPEPRPALSDDSEEPAPSLKEFFLDLTVDTHGWKASHGEDIKRLRTFCMERKVLVLVDITYVMENPNMDRIEQGFRDGGYDVFDADYTEDIDEPL